MPAKQTPNRTTKNVPRGTKTEQKKPVRTKSSVPRGTKTERKTEHKIEHNSEHLNNVPHGTETEHKTEQKKSVKTKSSVPRGTKTEHIAEHTTEHNSSMKPFDFSQLVKATDEAVTAPENQVILPQRLMRRLQSFARYACEKAALENTRLNRRSAIVAVIEEAVKNHLKMIPAFLKYEQTKPPTTVRRKRV